jgi:hypothetical protein
MKNYVSAAGAVSKAAAILATDHCFCKYAITAANTAMNALLPLPAPPMRLSVCRLQTPIF